MTSTSPKLTRCLFMFCLFTEAGGVSRLRESETEAVSCVMENTLDNMEELQNEEKIELSTWLGRCVPVLVKIKFIPLKERISGESTFDFCSLETFTSFILYYVSSVSLFAFSFLFFRASLDANKSETLDSLALTDFLSYLGFNLTNFFLFPLLPIILGNAAAQVTQISLSPTLPWPSIGFKIIICELFTALGYTLSIVPSILHYAVESFEQNCIFIILSILCLVLVCLSIGFCVTVSQVIIFSWMDKLAVTAEDTDANRDISTHARMCVEQYNMLNQALGFYFFFNFAVFQFAWIFSAYLSVTNILNLDQKIVDERHGGMLLLSMKSSGMFIMSLCCLWHLLHMVAAAENLKKR